MPLMQVRHRCVAASVGRKQRCGCVDGMFFFVFLLMAAIETDVRAVAGLLDPASAAAASLLCRSKQEQHTTYESTHK